MSDELKLPPRPWKYEDGGDVFDANGKVIWDGDLPGCADEIIRELNTAAQLREQCETLREACEECLIVVDECYKATGHVRVATTSKQRLKIEAALSGTGVSEAAKLREENWAETPPTQSGFYWHWNGDEDCAPLPLSVMWSGSTGKCFVSIGQFGITQPVDCDEYGGWWQQINTPALPGREQPCPQRWRCNICGGLVELDGTAPAVSFAKSSRERAALHPTEPTGD